MNDELISQFSAVTNASRGTAENWLNLSNNDLSQAVELYFAAGPNCDQTEIDWESDPSVTVAPTNKRKGCHNGSEIGNTSGSRAGSGGGRDFIGVDNSREYYDDEEVRQPDEVKRLRLVEDSYKLPNGMLQ